MAFLLLGVKTKVLWIDNIAKTPIVGGIFLFVCMFIPAVLISLLLQKLSPDINNDVGFTKAMLLILPGWNLFLWLIGTRLYFFGIPSWMLFGIIAIVKGVLMITGVSNGQ